MKRILILTGAENFEKESNINNKVEEMFNMTLPSKQRYAKKYNYDLSVIRYFGIDEQNKLQRTDRNVGFLRFLRAAEMINYYDIVMWLDGDALITNEKYSIDLFKIDEEHTFYASWDWMHKTPYFNGYYFHAFSLGNFILNRTKYLNSFLDTFFKLAKHFPEEQSTLNMMYAKTKYQSTFKILDHCFLNGAPKEIETIWNNGNKIVEPWNNTHFLAHLTGISNEKRIELMNNIFKEYL